MQALLNRPIRNQKEGSNFREDSAGNGSLPTLRILLIFQTRYELFAIKPGTVTEDGAKSGSGVFARRATRTPLYEAGRPIVVTVCPA
ncbi:hypothetical protein KEC55_29985 [Burkholderia cepacia]|uniref:hypothetical protein n=1 Tax=Burkholderia cepacia TaxID=292 RepID=UPI00249D9B79|nr:hypothetical protein [Burkholderia cepacia]WGY71226.1 hypothetical protein KEC55_29985 [Burkholderia cepacia]